MKTFKIFLAMAMALLGLAILSPQPAVAKAKIHCKPGVGMLQVDPIVSRGAAQSHHLHEFFGNKFLTQMAEPQNANYSDLVGKATQCRVVGDSAAYWIPALLDNGKPLPAARFIAYYRSFDHKDVGQAVAYPKDLRMVTAKYNWTCGQNSSMSNPIQTIPNCAKSTGTTYLTLHMDFPSCWDGKLNDHTVNGNTADFAPSGVVNHLAFYKKGSPNTCPAGFPIKLPELRETISWGNGSPSYFNGRVLRLDSDAVGQAPGTSAHADFWNTWVQSELERIVAGCINKMTAPDCDL